MSSAIALPSETAAVPGTTFRYGRPDDADAILALVDANMEVGHLLPRTRDDLATHAERFIVIEADGVVVGCGELAPLSRAVAEVRSLVVDAAWRGRGLGLALISALRDWARLAGFTTLCALTHDPSAFVRLGFSIVPHVWFPEKIALDCTGCSKFRTCGQHAVALAIGRSASVAPSGGHHRLPLASASGLRLARADAPARPAPEVPSA